MWHEIFNSILVGMGGVCIWVFKYHYQRFMAAHDLQRKADADWRAAVDADIAELKRIYSLDAESGEAGQKNGVDKQSDTRSDDRTPRGNRGRIRDS